MKVDSLNSRSTNSTDDSPKKAAPPRVDPRHIDEAIIAVIASSAETQRMTSASLGNPRSANFADMPENLLETSTTPPPRSSATVVSGGYAVYATSQCDTPVFASLTPVHVELAGLSPVESSKSSNVCGTGGLTDSSALTQLFPMAPNAGGGRSVGTVSAGSLPGYLAVKVEPQEVVIGGTVVSSGTVGAVISPSQFNISKLFI